jgi:hypothetical protein
MSMKFRINGKEYDAGAGVEKATLQTLYVLKVKHGIGMRSLADAALRLEKITDPMEILEDPEGLQAFMVIVWLARKQAGEFLTLEEANDDFGIADLELVEDDEPEVGSESPKAVTGSVPAGKKRKGKKAPNT